MADVGRHGGWCVWVLYPWKEEWIAQEFSFAGSRSMAIQRHDSYANNTKWLYRNKRRRGEARCVRSIVILECEGDLS